MNALLLGLERYINIFIQDFFLTLITYLYILQTCMKVYTVFVKLLNGRFYCCPTMSSTRNQNSHNALCQCIVVNRELPIDSTVCCLFLSFVFNLYSTIVTPTLLKRKFLSKVSSLFTGFVFQTEWKCLGVVVKFLNSEHRSKRFYKN